MDTSAARKVARRLILLSAAIALSALSHAGDFTFTPGTWSNVTTTGTTSGLLVTPTSEAATIAANLSLKALAAGTYTAQGTWSFSATWTPSTAGETPPANVSITLWHYGTMTASGVGVAKLTSGGTDLAKVDSTNQWESGSTRYLTDIVVTLPLIAQGDGTYKAMGSVSTATLSTTFDTQGSTAPSAIESYALGDIVGSN